VGPACQTYRRGKWSGLATGPSCWAAI
jgi:hypothetical protein